MVAKSMQRDVGSYQVEAADALVDHLQAGHQERRGLPDEEAQLVDGPVQEGEELNVQVGSP